MAWILSHSTSRPFPFLQFDYRTSLVFRSPMSAFVLLSENRTKSCFQIERDYDISVFTYVGIHIPTLFRLFSPIFVKFCDDGYIHWSLFTTSFFLLFRKMLSIATVMYRIEVKQKRRKNDSPSHVYSAFFLLQVNAVSMPCTTKIL